MAASVPLHRSADRPVPGIPAEWAVIFRSAGSPPGGGWEGLEQWGGRSLEWEPLLVLAHPEGALARLAWLASNGAFPGMPAGLRSQLLMAEQMHAVRAALLEERLLRLTAALEAADVPFLALKGAALASTVYPGFQHRPMGDLDLLVAEEGARTAVEVALASGWSHVTGVPGEDFFDGHQHLPPLQDSRGIGIGLDLHVHILPDHAPFSLPVQDIWDSSIPAQELAAAGPDGNPSPPPLRVPSAELLLLHACIHFAWSHTLAAGGWKVIRDVALLLRSPLLDADRFLALGRSARAVGSIDWTLHLVHQLGGIEEAGELRGRLGSTGGSLLRRGALTRHFARLMSGGVPEGLPMRLPRVLWEMAVLPDREGHNGARPWDSDDLFQREAGREDGREGPRAGTLARLREAMEYLARLASSRSSPPAPRPWG